MAAVVKKAEYRRLVALIANLRARWQELRQLDLLHIARDVWRRADEDNVFNSAAALPFYLMLSIFPGLSFLLSLLPYLPIPRLAEAIMELVRQVLPGSASELLRSTVVELVSERRGGLLSLSLFGTLWASSTGMYGVMHQLNITYRVKEARSFLKARATALFLTFLFGVLIVSTFAIVVLGGVLQDYIGNRFGWSGALLAFFAVFRWLVIFVALVFGFGVIYSLAPNLKRRFQWVSPGAVIGAFLLLVVSLGFRVYVENFGTYSDMYGGLGAAIVLMLWLYAAGLVLLLGSELNAALEERARERSTKNEDSRG